MSTVMEEVDLYEILGISRDATKADIKKAYHKAALQHHPDRVPETERPAAEIKFKAAGQAYEILSDDQMRAAYDREGMAAFSAGGSRADDVDIDDLMQQFYGTVFGNGPQGGASFAFGASGFPARGARRNQVQEYYITLEEAFKGKTAKFSSTKNVLCSHCHGTGGKEKAKKHPCATCNGQGSVTRITTINGVPYSTSSECPTCHGAQKIWRDKDKCKKCKGTGLIPEKKILELYVPPGSQTGDRIVLHGEGDQVPGQESSSDLIFSILEHAHSVFSRKGADLSAEVHISLAEALTGLDRIVLRHLDGRAIKVSTVGKGKLAGSKVLEPGHVLKVPGEGMPVKRKEIRGDLYIVIRVEFPKDGWLDDKSDDAAKLQALLPELANGFQDQNPDELVEEVAVEDGDLDDYGSFGRTRKEADDSDDDEWEEDGGQPQCQTQ